MGLTATMFRIRIDLSDVDRSVYTQLDLRVARHPSETPRHMIARTLAYCLCHEEGIAFSRGLSTSDEPALWVKDLTGQTTVWIEVGTPSADRLHRARKAVDRVVVVTHNAPALLFNEVRGKTVHRRETIEVYSLAPPLLDGIAEATDRNASWEVVRSDGVLYVTVGGRTFQGEVTKHELPE
jgi:uncharacterized protein YaeQ